MRLDLHTLKLFIAVVDTGSIAAAAEKQFIAVSALSKRLSELERKIGFTLLLRRARGVEPTEAGFALAKRARQLLHSADDLAAEIDSLARGDTGRIRIAANASTVTEFLPHDLLSFYVRQPSVEIDIDECVSHEVIRAVADGKVDMGICVPLDASEHGLKLYTYRRDRLVLAVPEAHPLAMRAAVRFEEVLGSPLIGMHKGSSLNELLVREAGKLKAPLQFRLRVTAFDAVLAMVRCGLGVGFIPDGVAEAMGRPWPLKFVVLDEPWAQRDLVLCVREAEPLSAAAQHLLDHLRQCSRLREGAEPTLAS